MVAAGEEAEEEVELPVEVGAVEEALDALDDEDEEEDADEEEEAADDEEDAADEEDSVVEAAAEVLPELGVGVAVKVTP